MSLEAAQIEAAKRTFPYQAQVTFLQLNSSFFGNYVGWTTSFPCCVSLKNQRKIKNEKSYSE